MEVAAMAKIVIDDDLKREIEKSATSIRTLMMYADTKEDVDNIKKSCVNVGLLDEHKKVEECQKKINSCYTKIRELEEMIEEYEYKLAAAKKLERLGMDEIIEMLAKERKKQLKK